MKNKYTQLEFGELMNPKRNKSNKPRAKSDFYETPFEMARETVNVLANNIIDLSNVKNVLDPGCGNGIWTEAVINYCKGKEEYREIDYYGIDINHPEYNRFIYTDFILGDYTDRDLVIAPDLKFDLIIGNPPFSLMEDFIRRSYELLSWFGILAFLGRLEFLGSQSRYRGLFSEFPLHSVLVSSRRPSWFSTKEKTKTTDMMEYAIFIWKKYPIKFNPPVIRWFMWEYDK